MENHGRRTLFLLDVAAAFQEVNSVDDTTLRQSLRQTLSELQKRCEALQRDTRVIADEMNELAHGAVPQLMWEGANAERVSVATAGDTTGYYKALASLDTFGKRLKEAKDALQSQRP